MLPLATAGSGGTPSNTSSPAKSKPVYNATSDLDKQSLIKLLECPVCMIIPAPPILMCEKGHNVCQKCRVKLQICPICQCNFSTARNFLAEQLLDKLNSKCPFSREGCDSVINVKDWEYHLDMCEYRSVICNREQDKKCQNVKLNYTNYFTHLTKVHKVGGVQGNVLNVVQYSSFEQATLSIEMPSSVWPVQYIEACNEKFLTATAVVPGKIFWWICLIGSEEVAQQFIGKICLQNRTQGIEMTWTGPVQSFRATPDFVLQKGMCLLATKETFPPFTHFRMTDPNNVQTQWNVNFSVTTKGRPLSLLQSPFNTSAVGYWQNLPTNNQQNSSNLPMGKNPVRPKGRVKSYASVGQLNLD